MRDDDRIGIFQSTNLLKMDSSDEDFLPDPERERGEQMVSSLKRKKKPPDRKDVNQQRGLFLHDDSTEGKCLFNILCVFGH